MIIAGENVKIEIISDESVRRIKGCIFDIDGKCYKDAEAKTSDDLCILDNNQIYVEDK